MTIVFDWNVKNLFKKHEFNILYALMNIYLHRWPANNLSFNLILTDCFPLNFQIKFDVN